jgi:hypothetical protein
MAPDGIEDPSLGVGGTGLEDQEEGGDDNENPAD